MTYEEIYEKEDTEEQKYINYTLIGEQGGVRVSIQNNESDPHFPVLKINDGVIDYKTHCGEGRGDSIKRSQELIFEIVKYRAVRTVPYDFDGEKYPDCVPTLNVLVFANVFLGEKFNYKEVVNEKRDSKITKNDINDYKNKSVLINGLGHASALFVDKEGKVYSFDTYGTHQYKDIDYKAKEEDRTRVNKSIGTISRAIAIEPNNRLQGDTTACTIWTVCALLEVNKYDNIEDALDLGSIDETELTCKFKPHVLNNIIKLVSCIECGTYEEFDRFIKLEQGVDIDYNIPEESNLISNETKELVGEYDTKRKVKKIIPPIISQSTIENVPTDSMSTPTSRISGEQNGVTHSRSSTPPPR